MEMQGPFNKMRCTINAGGMLDISQRSNQKIKKKPQHRTAAFARPPSSFPPGCCYPAASPAPLHSGFCMQHSRYLPPMHEPETAKPDRQDTSR